MFMASPRLFSNMKLEIEGKSVKLGNIRQYIPYQKLPDGSGYFLYFKLNDHPEWVNEGARLIAEHIESCGINNPYFVTPEASTIALAHVLRSKYHIPGRIVYKNNQINDVDPISVQYDAITSTDKKQLFLGLNHVQEMKNRNIIILDSICTSGGTLRGTYDLLIKAGVPMINIREACVLFTEDTPRIAIDMSDGTSLPLTSFQHMSFLKNEEKVVELKS
jgi:adenine/guanine phosphoribosyltransferase-like PRPP-binding protein